MKSIIQKSLYALFLASYIFSASCFANENETPKENNETTSSSLKKKKGESQQTIDENYLLFILVPAAIIIVCMLFKGNNTSNNSGGNQTPQENNTSNNIEENQTPQRPPINYEDPAVKDAKNNFTSRNNSPDDLLYTHTDKNNKEAVRYLLEEAGADVNYIYNHNKTVLHIACENGHEEIVKILLQHTANKVNIDAQDEDGETALHIACRCFYPEIVKELLNNNADATKKNNSNLTPLHSLCNGDVTKEQENTAVEIVKLLVDHGADINAQDESNETAMDMASGQGLNKILNELKSIKKGKDQV